LSGLIDFDAGVIAEGTETVESVGREMFEYVIEVANGRPTAAETLNSREFAFARLNPNWAG